MTLNRIVTALFLMMIIGCTTKEVSNDARLRPTDTDTKLKKDAPIEKPISRPTLKAQQSIPQKCKEKEAVADMYSEKKMRRVAPSSASKRACRKPALSRRPPVRRSRVESGINGLRMKMSPPMAVRQPAPQMYAIEDEADMDYTNEQYNHIAENGFKDVLEVPLSTFSIDVDAASYSNMRRFLNRNTLPPVDAVRIEEMINYFSYDYPQPDRKHPFSITAEVGKCPWNADNKLVHIGLQGRNVSTEKLPPNNLVFLLDVSGSMNSPDKLPLLKMGLKLLINQLRKEDRIAITVYAGSAGLVLPPTPGNDRVTILDALDRLQAGGSTAGGAGIELAYQTVKKYFMKGGNNRVILATDGDFNVGLSSDDELVNLIERKRNDGIYLTVLGFGTGNYKDSKMEQLADKGNGNYAYIDNLLEAKKVLVNEMGGTLLTIAKDVKIQIEFNPANVAAYRLIGYENRKLADRDFNDDTKDAGELGAGHTVTALYEIVPAGANNRYPSVDPLKYQKPEPAVKGSHRSELLTVKFRYKKPDQTKSRLIVTTVDKKIAKSTSDNFKFSAAVAGFGMLLRNSEYTADMTWETVLKMARGSKGKDKNGYRSECIKLMEQAQLLDTRMTSMHNLP